MEKQLTLLAVIVFMFFSSVFAGTYSGGTGEPNDPYRIATAEDMNAIGADSNDWDAHFLLVADINLADYTGTQFNIIGNDSNAFNGVFDGNNHKIWNFTWDSNGLSNIGLFGYVYSAGQIINLGMEDVNINATNGEYVGGLVGCNGGTMTNCYSTGRVSGYTRVGGLVGWNRWSIGIGCGTISNCYATCSVTGMAGIGGLAGWNSGAILNSYATASITGDFDIGGLAGLNGFSGPAIIKDCYATGTVSGDSSVGGLVGDNWYPILNCYATGAVSGNYSTGGLAGNNYCGTISNCYATGVVDGNNYTGGLVGKNYSYKNCGSCLATITNCYSTGPVDGNNCTGGLVGYNGGEDSFSYGGTISNCYATGAVDGNDYTGGLVGFDDSEGVIESSFWDIETSGPDNGIGTPLPTAEMQTESTFADAGWDFVDIWDIGENQTYPFLRVYPAGDINHDDIVNFYDFAILAGRWLEGSD